MRSPLQPELVEQRLQHLAPELRQRLGVTYEEPIVDVHKHMDAHARHTTPQLVSKCLCNRTKQLR